MKEKNIYIHYIYYKDGRNESSNPHIYYGIIKIQLLPIMWPKVVQDCTIKIINIYDYCLNKRRLRKTSQISIPHNILNNYVIFRVRTSVSLLCYHSTCIYNACQNSNLCQIACEFFIQCNRISCLDLIVRYIRVL